MLKKTAHKGHVIVETKHAGKEDVCCAPCGKNAKHFFVIILLVLNLLV